jgi:hypothetical protein
VIAGECSRRGQIHRVLVRIGAEPPPGGNRLADWVNEATCFAYAGGQEIHSPSQALAHGICPGCMGAAKVIRFVPVEGIYDCRTCEGTGTWPPGSLECQELPAESPETALE